MKTCNRCKQTKPLTDFHKDKSKSDGRTTRCKTCISEVRSSKHYKQKARDRYHKNPEKYRKRSRDYHKSEAGKAARKKHYHSEKGRLRRKKYQDSGQAQAWALKYAHSQRGTAKLGAARARKRNQSPQLTDSQQRWIEIIYLRARRMTIITGIPHEVDHIWPLSKGGLHVPWNLQVLPASVNRSKGARLMR